MAENGEQVLEIDSAAAERIQEMCGENAYLCYQCRKCTAGCPVSDLMDLAPNQVVRAIQLGQLDMVFESKTLWLCASCQTCVTRCPHGVDLPRMMDTLRSAAIAKGLKPSVPAVADFLKVAARDINIFGRLYEAGVMAELNLRSGKPFKDLDIGWELFRRGKLGILPKVARGKVKKGERPMPAPDEIAYYPGCSAHGTAKEYDMSTRVVAEDLGVRLAEPEGWVCCGTTAAHSTSHHTATALPMKNLALIASEGHERVTTGCASCYSRFKSAIHDVGRDEELRQAVARDTGYTYEGEVQVEHLIDTFADHVGLERVRQSVKRPLDCLKVVCYYGCLLTRPRDVTGAEHHEYPMKMDYLLRAAGAETLDWNYKTECCGSSLSLSETEVALQLSERILADAVAAGADAIVVACPLCQSNLDVRQPKINAAYGKDYSIPVLYFTEALGLAFGRTPKELGLDKHLVNAEPVLIDKGVLAPTGRTG